VYKPTKTNKKMETKKFTVVHLAQLRLNHLFALIKSTIQVVLPYKATLGGLLEVAFTRLQAANSALDDHLNQPQGSLSTPELRSLDAKRDAVVEEIKRDTKAAAKSSDPAKGEAGKLLLRFLTPYWHVAKLALNTESSMLDEITERYNADPALVAAANTLGQAPLWVRMGELNADFKALYYERNIERAAKEDPAGKFRSDVTKSYTSFCTLAEQQLDLTPSEDLNKLFEQIDGLRKTYHAMSVTSAKKGEQPVAEAKGEQPVAEA
jgi:hypothetical protein